MTQTLYLIRHTAPAVAPGVCYGQLDAGVASSFEQEAEQVLSWLPPVELVITSPLARARRLAEYLAQARNTELRADARLMEIHFGAWEGKEWNSIERKEIDAWAADLMGYAPPGGESAQQMAQRVRALLHDIGELPQQYIALSTHGGVIRTVLAQMAGMPLQKILQWEVAQGAVLALRF